MKSQKPPGHDASSEITPWSVTAGLKANALSKLSSGIAHEINNPLTIILGHAENLIASAQKGFISPTEVTKSANAILQSSQRVNHVVRGFRNFARDGSQDPIEAAQFQAIFERVTALSRARFRNHDVELLLELPPADMSGFCRPHEMEQSLFYVLCVMFDTALEAEVKWVKLSAIALNEHIQIRIDSSCSGVSDDVRSFLDSSKVLSEASDWIGLAVAKELTEAFGAKLYVDLSAPSLRVVIEVPKGSSEVGS